MKFITKNLSILLIITINIFINPMDEKKKADFHKRTFSQSLDANAKEKDDNTRPKQKARIDSNNDDSTDNQITNIASACKYIVSCQDYINSNSTKIQEDLLNYFEKNNLKKCLELESELSEDNKKLLHQAIIEKSGNQLKAIVKPGLSSFICGATFGLLNLEDTKKVKDDISFVSRGNDTQVEFNHSSNKVLMSHENQLSVFDTTTGEKLDGHEHEKDILAININKYNSVSLKENNILKAAYSLCGKYLATSTDDVLQIDDLKIEESKIIFYDSNSTPKVMGITFSPNSKLIAVSFDNNIYYIWNIETEEKQVVGKKIKEGLSSLLLCSVAFSNNSKFLTTVFNRPKFFMDDEIYHCDIWDIKDGSHIKELNFPEKITSIIFSPCKQFTIATSTDVIYFSNAFTNEILKKYKINNPFYITNIKLNNDGNQFIVILGTEGKSKKIAELLNFSNSWIINNLSLKQLILITKLIINPNEVDTLNEDQYKTIFYNLHAQTIKEIINGLLPKLVLNQISKTSNINDPIFNPNCKFDISNCVLEYAIDGFEDHI